MENNYSYKGREQVRYSLQRFISLLCHEMDSNHRIPYDKVSYDYLVSLSYEIDRELSF